MDDHLVGNLTNTACSYYNSENVPEAVDDDVVNAHSYDYNGFTPQDNAHAKVSLGQSFIGGQVRLVDAAASFEPVAGVQIILLTPDLYYGGSGKSVLLQVAVYGYTKDHGEPTIAEKVTVSVETPAGKQSAVNSQTVTLQEKVLVVSFNLPAAWFQGGVDPTLCAVHALLETKPSDKIEAGSAKLFPQTAPVPAEADSQRLEAELPYQGVYTSSNDETLVKCDHNELRRCLNVDVYARTDQPLRIIDLTAVVGGEAKGVQFVPKCINAVNPNIVQMEWKEMEWKDQAIRSSKKDMCTYAAARAVVPGKDPRVNGRELIMQLKLEVPSDAKPGSYSVQVFVSKDLDSVGDKAISRVEFTGIGVSALVDGRLDNGLPPLPAIHIIENDVMGMFARIANTNRLVNTAVLDGVDVPSELAVTTVSRTGLIVAGQGNALGGRFAALGCKAADANTLKIVYVSDNCNVLSIRKSHTKGGKGKVTVSLANSDNSGMYVREVGVRVWFPPRVSPDYVPGSKYAMVTVCSGYDAGEIDCKRALRKFKGWKGGPAYQYEQLWIRVRTKFEADAGLYFVADITHLLDVSTSDASVATVVSVGEGNPFDLPSGASRQMIQGVKPGDFNIQIAWETGTANYDGYSVSDEELEPVQLHAFAVRKADVKVTALKGAVCATVPADPPTLTYEGDKVTIYAKVELKDSNNESTFMPVTKMYGLEVTSLNPAALEVQENDNEFELVVPAGAPNAALGSLVTVWWNPLKVVHAILRSCAKLAVLLPSPDKVTVELSEKRLTRSSNQNSARKAGIPVVTEVTVMLHWDAKDGVAARSQPMSGDSRTLVNLDGAGNRLQINRSNGGKLSFESTVDADIGTAEVMIHFTHTPLNQTIKIYLVEFERFVITAEPDPPTCDNNRDNVNASQLSLIKGTQPPRTNIFQRAKATCKMGLSDKTTLDLKSDVSFASTAADVVNLHLVQYSKTDLGHLSGNVVATPLKYGTTYVSCSYGWDITNASDFLLLEVAGQVEVAKITKYEIIQGSSSKSTVLSENRALRGATNIDEAESCLQVQMTDGHCYGRGRTYCSPFEATTSELPGLLSFESDNQAVIAMDSATGVVGLLDNSLRSVKITATAAGTTAGTVDFEQSIAANLDPVGVGDVDIGRADGNPISTTLTAGDTFDLEIRVNTGGSILKVVELFLAYGTDIEPLLDGEAVIRANGGAVTNVAGCDLLAASMNARKLRIRGLCKLTDNIKNDPAPPKGTRWRSPGVHLVTVKLKALKTGVPAITGYARTLGLTRILHSRMLLNHTIASLKLACVCSNSMALRVFTFLNMATIKIFHKTEGQSNEKRA
jgi:hypothetical protein